MPRRRKRRPTREPARTGSGFRGVVEIAGLVVPPATVLTALLFWIGWMRTVAVYDHFGIPVRLVDLTDQDYVQRSVDGLFTPLLVMIGTAVGAIWAHTVVRDGLVRRRRHGAVRALCAVLLAVGLPALVLGVTGVAVPLGSRWLNLAAPLLLGAGALAVVYARWLWRCRHGRKPAAWNRTEVALVGLVLLLCAFWGATNYARAVGQGEARAFADRVALDPGVVVYSERRLYFPGKPVATEDILPDEPPSTFRYKYSGLHLFAETKDRLFLVPAPWTAGSRTVVVPLGPDIRIDLLPGPGA